MPPPPSSTADAAIAVAPTAPMDGELPATIGWRTRTRAGDAVLYVFGASIAAANTAQRHGEIR